MRTRLAPFTHSCIGRIICADCTMKRSFTGNPVRSPSWFVPVYICRSAFGNRQQTFAEIRCTNSNVRKNFHGRVGLDTCEISSFSYSLKRLLTFHIRDIKHIYFSSYILESNSK